MEISVIKDELNKILIKTNFEDHNNKKHYILTREDMIRLCIKLIKLIERVNNERDYWKIKEMY